MIEAVAARAGTASDWFAGVAWNFLVVRGTLAMATGKVKWFNNAKGYGFILPEGGGEDLFVHYSSIQMDGYKTLKAGQDVEFDVLEGPKGFHAVNIRTADTGTQERVGWQDEETDGSRTEAPLGASAEAYNGSTS